MAMHGGGPGVMLFASGRATDAQLHGEWIAVHELSHLWLPPLAREDAPWLPEGFASYYQCILRSRVGMYDESTAWDELLSGLERGAAQARASGDVPLARASRPHYQHIYWGGAALMLALDVDERKRRSSLDRLVATARRTSPTDDEDATSQTVIAALSRAAGRDLGPRFADAASLPFLDLQPLLKDLGVVRRGRSVVLDDAAPLAHLRRAIAARRD